MSPGILFVTHSSRPVDLERCSLNFLTERYADPQRLHKLPELEHLHPAQSSDFSSGLSLHLVAEGKDGIHLNRLAWLRTDECIQQVCAGDEHTLLVCFECFIEVWVFGQSLLELRGDLGQVKCKRRRIEHPLFAGLHNLVPLDAGRLAVSASAADAVLIIDLADGRLDQMLRMPAELYGSNYELRADTDLQRHYIGNDQQTTHINHVSRLGDHYLLVSALIPGALGIFDRRDGRFSEVAHGFVGCHGARGSSSGEIYFADSCNGNIVWLDQDGHIARRADLSSNWLHDVQEIQPGLYACSIADANTVAFYDSRLGKVVQRVEFPISKTGLWSKLRREGGDVLGNSTKFLSYFSLSAEGG